MHEIIRLTPVLIRMLRSQPVDLDTPPPLNRGTQISSPIVMSDHLSECRFVSWCTDLNWGARLESARWWFIAHLEQSDPEPQSRD